MFISLHYLLLLSAAFILYHIIPLRYRWTVLFIGSLAFYTYEDKKGLPLLVIEIFLSYVGAMGIARMRERSASEALKRAVLAVFLILVLLPLIVTRIIFLIFRGGNYGGVSSLFTALGISFFSLQITAYLIDIYKGKTEPEKNILKYALFISFFPQILQGPIPRYDLMERLFEGHSFNADNLIKGFQLILWGFFLKLLIADRAGVFVDAVYADTGLYGGAYALIAGILYSIQLYADFSSCVCIAKGSAEMFGIALGDNFLRPYFAVSIKDFWRRWHISLSLFLRDYVYIPLGGSRRGRIRKYLNLLITFFVSGLWHGGGLNYIFWGLLHGFYEIAGELTQGLRETAAHITGFKGHEFSLRVVNTVITFFLVMNAWIIFRAESLSKGLHMIGSIFTRMNPWVLFDGSLLIKGFEMKDWLILIFSLCCLFMVSYLQERGIRIRDRIAGCPALVRGSIYMATIVLCVLFGKYGAGFDAGSFIYAGF